MFNKNNKDAKSHHIANAQLSHINILAGNMLKNINDAKIAKTITTKVVAIYV
jgi:hypothetical protein